MIKFWKSAAKGKSGYPVRPPELRQDNVSQNNDVFPTLNKVTYHLETVSEEETVPFLKESRLSKTLIEILKDQNSASYFMQYLESVEASSLLKFWTEVESFKLAASSLVEEKEIESSPDSQNQLSRSTIANGLKQGHYNVQTQCRNSQLDLKCSTFSDDTHNYYTTEKTARDDFLGLPENIHLKLGSQSLQNKLEKFQESPILVHNVASSSLPPDDVNSRRKAVTDDAINIFKTYIALESLHKLDLSDNVRTITISNICHPSGLVDVNCFKVAQEIVFEIMESKYFDAFTKSPLHSKYQIDILTSGSLTLADIQNNDMALFYFMEFLEQEQCNVLLECLMAINNFSENISADSSKPDLTQVQSDAIVLYEKYFSLQATSPIGFSSDVRLEVEENICREDGPLPSCFHRPFRILTKTLQKYVQIFLESELYFKYLTEMINSVHAACSSSSGHKKTYSDCGSDISISTQNTLLAMGDLPFRDKTRKSSEPDMTIDSNQLYNADALWQRKRQDGLSLGRINSLGRFESKFDPDPDKKSQSLLKKVARRLVAGAGPVEEELAWQVAHMIVKDITDLTMAPTETQ